LCHILIQFIIADKKTKITKISDEHVYAMYDTRDDYYTQEKHEKNIQDVSP